ncbi:hypothetical protein L484_026324 [Morus notabilis]|uniref:Uncharacterized protein n=1 Tax=Morus notabilis TaxID=981085 RepID=W9QXT5_9ROSA|nr:hypothetical protein L484_026324 [Morus notabilis]
MRAGNLKDPNPTARVHQSQKVGYVSAVVGPTRCLHFSRRQCHHDIGSELGFCTRGRGSEAPGKGPSLARGNPQ